MCERYSRALLRVSVAQVCQALGWDSVQLTACDLLTDVLQRYLQQLGRGCQRHSELYGRTDPLLDDVGQAFKLMGVNLHELEDYIHNIEPVTFPHQIPCFPVSKNNVLQFPQPGSKDAEERKEYIPEYLPPIVSSQEEEEEEQVPTDGGTSAEAMQVPLEEEEEMDEDLSINDENYFGKRPLDSPETMDMPAMKRQRIITKGDFMDSSMEPREPLSLINSQKVPPMLSPVHIHEIANLVPAMPEPPMLAPVFKLLCATPKQIESKSGSKSKAKSSSPGHKSKSPKASQMTNIIGSPIRSPKPVLKEKKSPGRAKSPRSPKSPKVPVHILQSTLKVETQTKTPLTPKSEKCVNENVQLKQTPPNPEMKSPENLSQDLGEADKAIDDSIDAVIARACADRELDPFEFSSGQESEGEVFMSPKKLTISEPATPKLSASTNSLHKGESTPLPQSGGTSSSDISWTMEDSINEVIRRANLGTPPVGNIFVGSSLTGNLPMANLPMGTPPLANPITSTPPKGTPSNMPASMQCFSSPSASPPTPEPLLKVFEERVKLASSQDVKKKLKKELKTKIRKKEREKQRDKEKGKDKNRDKDKSREKDKDRESKLMWKDLSNEEDLESYKFIMKDLDEGESKSRQKDGSGKRDRERHKDKKKDREKGRRDKEKKEKSKDRMKEEKSKTNSVSIMLPLKDMAMPMFSTPSGMRLPSLLPALSPLFPEKLFEDKDKPKEKEKKKDKKDKKKKKDREKEKGKEKDKKEKEKKEKEKEKEKEKHKPEKVKVEPVVPAPSPVIPRLTLRVGAGQDKIVISKVVAEAKAAAAATLAKTSPMPPSPAPAPALVAPSPLPSPLPQPPPPQPPPTVMATPSPPLLAPPAAAVILPLVPPASPAMTSSGNSRMPVRSVVTETVSTYVIRDEWGNQIWICPGCNKADDGSPMIGCDGCDDWYHWPCVGIKEPPPEEAQWFCPKCGTKKKEKKHKKRKHRAH